MSTQSYVIRCEWLSQSNIMSSSTKTYYPLSMFLFLILLNKMTKTAIFAINSTKKLITETELKLRAEAVRERQKLSNVAPLLRLKLSKLKTLLAEYTITSSASRVSLYLIYIVWQHHQSQESKW